MREGNVRLLEEAGRGGAMSGGVNRVLWLQGRVGDGDGTIAEAVEGGAGGGKRYERLCTSAADSGA